MFSVKMQTHSKQATMQKQEDPKVARALHVMTSAWIPVSAHLWGMILVTNNSK